MDIRIFSAILLAFLVACSGVNFGGEPSNNSTGFELANPDQELPQEQDVIESDGSGHGNNGQQDNNDKNDDHKNDHKNHKHDNKCGHGHGHNKNPCKDVKVRDIIVNVDDIILKGHGVTTHSPATGMDEFSLVNDPLIVTPAANVSPHQIRLILNTSGNTVIDNKGNVHPLHVPSQNQTGLKLLMPPVSMNANTSYRVKYKLIIEKQVVRGGNKCLLKPVLKGIGIEPIACTGQTTGGSTDGGTTDGGTTDGTTDGGTTGNTDGGTTTGTTTGSTTGGDVCQQCFACITAGGTIEQCTPPCNLDCF